MSAPLVSICMPSYNYARFLEASVQSAFAQSYRPIELIVVDDGSTDDSGAILERLVANAPIPMKTLLGAHRGVSAALNLALREAKGEWICILAADDVSKPERVARLMSVVEDGVVLVHSEYDCIDANGVRTGYDSSTDLPPAKGDSLRDLLELLVDVRSMTVMLRRSAMNAQPYDEALPGEDWQSILRLAKSGRVAHVPEALVERRVHNTNASFTGHRKKTTFSFNEIGIDVLKEVTPPDLQLDRILATHTAVALRNALALGAFAKVADGLRQGFAEFPSQRAFLVRETLRGIPSFIWMSGLREALPAFAVRSLVRAKSASMSFRARRLQQRQNSTQSIKPE